MNEIMRKNSDKTAISFIGCTKCLKNVFQSILSNVFVSFISPLGTMTVYLRP